MSHVGRVLTFGGIVAVLLACGSADVFAAKKKKEGKGVDLGKYPPAVDADYKAIQKNKELTGKLVSLDGINVTVRVEYPHYEANPKYKAPTNNNPKSTGYNPAANQQGQMWRTYNEIQREKQQAARARTPQEYQRAMQRIAQDMARLQQEIMRMNQQSAKAGAKGVKVDPKNQPFIIVTSTKDFDLPLKDKVVLRKMVLPFEYDDTGMIKKYTEKELAEMRGDDKTKPGYTAKIEDFMAGQEVKLTLGAVKKTEKAADADKDGQPMADVPRPTVSMIVMTKDNGSPPIEPKKKR